MQESMKVESLLPQKGYLYTFYMMKNIHSVHTPGESKLSTSKSIDFAQSQNEGKQKIANKKVVKFDRYANPCYNIRNILIE